MLKTMTHSKTRSLEDIYTYAAQAYDLLDPKKANYEELKSLLMDQVNDELNAYDNSRAN